MNAVYDISDGRRLILYMEHNRILVLMTPFYRGSVPLIRHRDCLGKLFSIVYRGKIYYVYENFLHQIVFACLDHMDTTVLLSPSEVEKTFEKPILTEIDGKLYLFYQVCTDTGEYKLKMSDPWNMDDSVSLYKNSSGVMECRWYRHEKRQFMSLYFQNECLETFAWENKSFCYVLWKGGQQTVFENRLHDKDEKYRELEIRYKALKENYEKLKRECDMCEQKLASAKAQYDELAQTAEELQKIGRLWRDKCLSRHGNPSHSNIKD